MGRGLSVAAGLTLLASCSPLARAPVMDGSFTDRKPETYRVVRHDTLYSIAKRFRLDYKALAAANGIGPPYLIREGQLIRLVEGSRQSARTVPAKPAPAKQSTPPPAKPVPAKSATSRPTKPAPAKPATPRPVKPPARPPVELATVAADGWRRPVSERPVRGFGGTSKGFDYALDPTTQIHAASGGIVVYVGPGLGGFRYLVIVKASDRYLVAYGINAAPLLQEGETVLPGTVVAKIESGGATAGEFHFEIRDRGEPVDPGKLILR